MSTKAARGTKRTCQNADCGSRFYDLTHNPIVCPMCSSQYVVPVSTPSAAAASAAAAAAARNKPLTQPDFEMADKADDSGDAVPEEALAELETSDEPVVVADDETFLEEEEDGGEAIGGILPGGEEPEET
jgi:uncharacterized protein (TIGR02300 family)